MIELLVDANLSPALIGRLVDGGYPARHVAEVGLLTASDEEIFECAAAERWTVVTADTDFPTMLALRRVAAPSVVLLRGVNDLSRAEIAALLLANLPQVVDDLAAGAVVSLSPVRLAVRALPFGR